MAVPLLNAFEGGSDGTTITTGNSGGASGDAFTSVGIGATHALTYENSPALSEGLCAVITPGVTSAFTEVEWDSTVVGTIGPTVYTRCYFRHVGAFLTVHQRFMALASGGTQRCALAYIASTRRFTWTDAADSLGTSSAIQLEQDTTYRFECEWTLSATVARAIINCYLGDSTTPLETLDSTANQNFGGTTMNRIAFGLTSGGSSANQGPLALDGLAIGTEDLFGPLDNPAFPTTGILDPFTGADENPIATNWTCPWFAGDDTLRRLSNQLTKNGAGFANGWYDLSTFGPDCEAYCTVVTKPATNDYISLLARTSDVGTATPDGYLIVITMSATADDWGIRVIQDGVTQPLGAGFTQEIADGDGIGISCVGDEITAWYRSAGGSWVSLAVRTDTTFTGAGYLALECFGVAGGSVLDDFGGGDVVSVSDPPLFMPARRRGR